MRTPRRVGAALVVTALVAAGCTPGTSSGQSSDPPLTETRTDSLFRGLSADVAHHDKAKFLAAFTGSGKARATRWWTNMAALGFSTGAFYPESVTDAEVALNSSGNGTVTVWAGAHALMDPVEADDEKAYVPLTSYRLTVHQDKESAPIRITGWTSLMNAPWDLSQLYVTKGRHVAVASYPDERRLADSLRADAERAAEYDIAMFKSNDKHDLKQTGFIVFVSAQAKRRATWLHAGKQPRGWSADPAGAAKPLPGQPGTLLPGIETNAVGGARVVFQPQGSSHENTAVLVHEFVHVVFATDTIWAYSDDKPAPAWTAEGIARLVESFYRTHPDPSLQTLEFNLNEMHSNPLRSRFRGAPPTDAQLYNGTAAGGSFWYDVAASVYGYLAIKYGTFDAFYAARIGYTDDSTPFSGVVQSDKGGTITYYRPSVIQAAWADWYRRTY